MSGILSGTIMFFVIFGVNLCIDSDIKALRILGVVSILLAAFIAFNYSGG